MSNLFEQDFRVDLEILDEDVDQGLLALVPAKENFLGQLVRDLHWNNLLRHQVIEKGCDKGFSCSVR
jgi:hypothetical protein